MSQEIGLEFNTKGLLEELTCIVCSQYLPYALLRFWQRGYMIC
jgi:hypothetical protein